MTDHEKGISDELITLEVTSPNVPDLTLIDLPGIARNAVHGQPDDIEDKVWFSVFKHSTCTGALPEEVQYDFLFANEPNVIL